MATKTSRPPADILRQLTVPVGVVVAFVVIAAWYVAWASSEFMMAPVMIGSVELGLFFALMIVMMVAMMLPSALPMILAYHGLTRLEGGQPVKRADGVATVAFIIPYFVAWGAFGVAAVLGLMVLGGLGPWTGLAVLIPAATLVAAGGWQLTRTKEVCLTHCQSPMGFVLHHWRSGRFGAMRMGLRHSMYCIGCCWLFMIVLFVAGSMSLVWMGALSLSIFVEKVGGHPAVAPRVIGVLLVVIGLVVAVPGLLV